MTHLTRRRQIALAALAAAALGAGTAAPFAQAVAGDQQPPASRSLLDPILGNLLDNLLTMTTAELQAALAGLSADELGDLLVAADAQQLQKILATVDTTQLDQALDTLTAGELAGVLGLTDPPQLPDVLALLDPATLLGALGTLDPTAVSALLGSLSADQLGALLGSFTPEQITSLIGLGGLDAVIAGLTGELSGLGSAPSPAQLDALVAQANALLGSLTASSLPADPTQLDALLTQLTAALTGAGGLDVSGLTALQDTVNGLLARLGGSGPTDALNGLLGVVGGLVGGSGGTTTPPPTNTTPPASTTPVAPAGTQLVTKPTSTRYRASISKVRIAKNRKTATAKVSCPAAAPLACVVRLTGTVAGRRAVKAQWLGITRLTSKTVKFKLTSGATKRLKRKGGTLKITAATAYSSLGSRTAKKTVKRPKAAKR